MRRSHPIAAVGVLLDQSEVFLGSDHRTRVAGQRHDGKGAKDGIDGAQIMSSLTRIVAAGVVVGGVAWAVGEFVGWSSFGHAVVAVVAGTAIGGVVYVGLLMRVEELSAVRSLVPARLRSRS